MVLIVLGILGFLLRDIYNRQQEFNTEVDQRIGAIEMRHAQDASLSLVEWHAVRSQIDTSINNLDKRVTRSEDNLLMIKEGLQEINRKIDGLLKQ